MLELFPFFVILFAGLIFSEIFNRLHLPYVTALILAGMLIGPFGFDLVEIDQTVQFLASIGVVFLMFIAGSEVKTDAVEKLGGSIALFALINGLVPFVIGLLIGWWFGFSLLTSLVLGTIFVSTSVAVIIPSLESTGLINTKFGREILPAVVLEDLASLLLFSFFLQSTSGRSFLPPWALLLLIIGILVVLRTVLPRLRKVLLGDKTGSDLFETELRFVFVVLLAAVVLFEVLGMHAIVAGFLIGILLGDSVRGRVQHKIHTVSYGLFIPVFFLIVGMQLDLSVLTRTSSLVLAFVIVLGSLAAKFISGVAASSLLGFTMRERLLAGVATVPQLSTTLAAAFTASQFGLLPDELVSSLIVLVIVSTFVAPLLTRSLAGRMPAH